MKAGIPVSLLGHRFVYTCPVIPIVTLNVKSYNNPSVPVSSQMMQSVVFLCSRQGVLSKNIFFELFLMIEKKKDFFSN